jgi:hypothetical protein
MARIKSVNDILKQVAIEVGLIPINSPVDSAEEAYIQLVGLMNTAGQELTEVHPWQRLVKTYEIETKNGDSGIYDLPLDFNYMIDQTGWDRNNEVPVGGPLSPQDWTYLLGRNLVSSTIYVSFRQWEGKMHLFPQPPPVGMKITFEYMSTNWLRNPTELFEPGGTHDEIQAGSDVCLIDSLLTTKFVKLKFLTAKGFDASAAAVEFENVLNSQTGKDTGARILSAGNNSRAYPYIMPYRNTGDSGMGM